MEKEIKKTEQEQPIDDIGGVQIQGHILIRDITDEEKPVELVNKVIEKHGGICEKDFVIDKLKDDRDIR